MLTSRLRSGAADQSAWALILMLAAANSPTARLGLLLVIPGGHVTSVWPPSGIALAAMLLCGRRVWPGIWLGSFAANLWDFVGVKSRLFIDPFNEQLRLLCLPSLECLNRGSMMQGALRDAVVVGREVELQGGFQLRG